MKNGKRVAAVLALLMVACAFWAQDVRAQTEPVFALAVEPGLLPSEALRGVLEAELGVRVAEAGDIVGIPTISVVRLPSGHVEVSLSSRDVPRASRELVLTAEIEQERVEMVALIAANLVRNEAASLLPELTDGPPPAPRVPPPPSPPLPDPCDLRGDAEFGIDLAPGVGASSTRAGRAATRRLSLGLAGTLSSRLHGIEFSFGANIQRVSVCGLQIATPGANLAFGRVTGMQFGTAFNYAGGDVIGVQFALANLAVRSLTGVQFGILTLARGLVDGVQFGVVSYAGGVDGLVAGVASLVKGDVDGVQIGVGAIATGSVTGLQNGVVSVIARDLDGLQVGVVSVAGGRVDGAQLGVVNFARRGVDGLQAGVHNVSAGPVHGVQLGVVNYAERTRASIGVLSIVRRGRTSIDVSGAVESGTLIAGVTHGGKDVHNQYGVGLRTGSEGERLVAQLGIGVRALSFGRVRLDIDALATHVFRKEFSENATVVTGVRVPVTVMLAGGFGVFIAPSYQVMFTQDADEGTQSLFGETVFDDGRKRMTSATGEMVTVDGGTRVIGYPGLTLGLRMEFDHGV